MKMEKAMKKKEMSENNIVENELMETVKEQREVASLAKDSDRDMVIGGTDNSYEFGEHMDASDYERDNILLAQKTSSFLDDPNCEAKPGELVRSDTMEVVGNSEKGVEVLPLKVYKTWRKKGEDGKSYGNIVFKEGDERYGETGTTDDGDEYELQLQYNVLVLLRDDPFALPFVVCLRTKSISAAKRINSIARTLQMRGEKPWAQAIELYSEAWKDDNKTWFKFKAKAAGETTAQEREVAASWVKGLTAVLKSKEDLSDDIPF